MNIRPEFDNYPLDEHTAALDRDARVAFSALLEGLETIGIGGRDLALAKTHLENACAAVCRGIARMPRVERHLSITDTSEPPVTAMIETKKENE